MTTEQQIKNHEVYIALTDLIQLGPDHYDNLVHRGFHKDDILVGGYKSLPSNQNEANIITAKLSQRFGEELLKTPGFYLKDGIVTFYASGGMVLPCFSEDGLINSLMVRHDRENNKYTHFSSGDKGAAKLNLVPHVPVGNFPTDQIYLTEGNFKADMVRSRLKQASASVAGVSSYSKFLNLDKLPEYSEIIIAFDRDLEWKYPVYVTSALLFAKLKEKNYNVSIATWNNDLKGLDDALRANEKINLLNGEYAETYLKDIAQKNNWKCPLDTNVESNDEWGPISELPDVEFKVPPFDPMLIPSPIREWAVDNSYRMQCPLEFIIAAYLVTLSSIIGRSFQVVPKMKDKQWKIVPQLWGAGIGLPSSKKTPAQALSTRLLDRIQARADEIFKDKMITYDAFKKSKEIELKTLDKELEKLYKNALQNSQAIETNKELRRLILEEIELQRPKHILYFLNDITVEALQDALRDNPYGLLLLRDELSGFLVNLERPGNETQRAFLLECFNGTGSYTVTRISRGTFTINPCASLYGGIQPQILSSLLINGAKNGSANDGFAQRLQLGFWPEVEKTFHYIDEQPDEKAEEKVNDILVKFADIKLKLIEKNEIVTVGLDPVAQSIFADVVTSLETRARSKDIQSEALSAHILKYPKLFCSLALIFELVERINKNEQTDDFLITGKSAELAKSWLVICEEHAKKIYGNAVDENILAAVALNQRLLKREINDSQPIRDIYKANWTHLNTKEKVLKAIQILDEFGIAKATEIDTGGRPSIVIKVNPKIFKREEMH